MVVDIMKSEPRYEAPQPLIPGSNSSSNAVPHHHIHHHHPRMPPLPPSSGGSNSGGGQVVHAGAQPPLQHNSLQRPGGSLPQNGINGVTIVNGQPQLDTDSETDKWWWICCLEFCFCLL